LGRNVPAADDVPDVRFGKGKALPACCAGQFARFTACGARVRLSTEPGRCRGELPHQPLDEDAHLGRDQAPRSQHHADRDGRRCPSEGIGEPPYPNWTAVGVNWLAGFDFEIEVIARIPQRA
jgi:hypothetical protein